MNKIIKYIFLLLLISSSSYAQNSYYWYQGKKIELGKANNKEFILIKTKSETTFKSLTRNSQQEIAPLQQATVSSTVKKINNSVNPDDYMWTTSINSSQLRNLTSSPDIIYTAPYYTNESGKDVGVSHIFYVKLKSENDLSILTQFANEKKVTIIGNNQYMPLWYLLMCTKESTGNALELANIFYESGKFAYAEPDLLQDEQIECVNDQLFSNQWGLRNNVYTGIDINYCNARNVTQGSSSVVVAIFDQGIQLNHPDINVYSKSYDIETGTSPSKIYGTHGTNCAGIVSAKANNSIGLAGVAPASPVMSISSSLSSATASASKKADGFNYARLNGASIISCSWNAPKLQIVDDAIKLAITNGRNGKGCIVVTSAGNTYGQGTTYPSEVHSDILVVGSIDSNGAKSNFSSWGTALDVMAPGGGIQVTTTGSGYTSGSGTSFAGPHVAGIAALILSVNPNLTQKEVANIIESTARKIGTGYTNTSGRPNGTWQSQMGYGLVDAYAAVIKAQTSGCTTTNYTDKTISSGTTNITGCNVSTKNVTVKKGAKLNIKKQKIFEAMPLFTVEAGALLDISNN